MPSTPPPPRRPSRPSSAPPPNQRSSSRPSGAALDPYGIYGARTATRLRDSRRRRRSQSSFVVFIVLALVVAAVAALKTRRIYTESASARSELAMPVLAPPLWVSTNSSGAGVLLIAGEDGRLLKIDESIAPNASPIETGKTVLLETDFPLRAPLVVGESAFVPCEDGVLYAVSWRQRKLLWRQRFDAALTAKPALITINKTPVIVAGSDSGLLMALDAASGKTVWKVRLPAPIGNSLVAVAPESAAGRARVLVPLLGGVAMRGGLWSLDGATGKTLWRFPKDARVEATQVAAPVVDEAREKIYAGNDVGAIFSLDLKTGSYASSGAPGWKAFAAPLKNHDASQATLLRAAPLLTGNASTPSNPPGVVVGGNDGGVRCFDAATGALRWQAEVDAAVSGLHLLQMTDGGEAILVCSRSSQLLLLNAANGAIIQQFSSGGEEFAGVTLSPRDIIAVTQSGAVLRFALSK